MTSESRLALTHHRRLQPQSRKGSETHKEKEATLKRLTNKFAMRFGKKEPLQRTVEIARLLFQALRLSRGPDAFGSPRRLVPVVRSIVSPAAHSGLNALRPGRSYIRTVWSQACGELERAFVPALAATMQRYLDSLVAVVSSPAQLEVTRKIVHEFEHGGGSNAQDGKRSRDALGPLLQEKLRLFASSRDNWVRKHLHKLTSLQLGAPKHCASNDIVDSRDSFTADNVSHCGVRFGSPENSEPPSPKAPEDMSGCPKPLCGIHYRRFR
ncbi:hypothetical protein MRX96_016787 [Rhipicephalus microplus]